MSDLKAIGLRKTYPTPAEDLVVLSDLNLELNRGDSVSVMGPSGCGKSTLLQILGVLDPPTAGTLTINDVDPYRLSEEEQAKFRNQTIGFIFQDHHLLPQWNVLENTLLPGLASGSVSDELRQRAVSLLERVGLKNRMHHLPSQLSGGERGRAAIARSLLLNPLLILADEPTGNLDEANSGNVADLLLELPREENAILVVVTHSSDLATKMKQQFVLHQGSLKPA